MRTLRDVPALLADDAGRAYLAAHGMFTDLDSFVAALRPPADDSLNALMALPESTPLVHIGQQVCADYDRAVVSKFEVAGLLELSGITPALLWHDCDRAGSERYGMRLRLPNADGPRGVWLAHRSLGKQEPRFIEVDPEQLEQLLAYLGSWLRSRLASGHRAAARARLAALIEAVRPVGGQTLSAVNRAIAEHLLREALGLHLRSTSLSAMLDRGLLTPSVNAYLAQIDDVIRVFNEGVSTLVADGIDPLVRPLDADHLPLFYSCATCGTRVRLVHERLERGHYAVAQCPCGVERRFHIGHRTISLGELEATDRWSPDVSLPVHLNRLASGWVVGRSTALYGMVLNGVTERVLGHKPIPGFVPPGLEDPADEGAPRPTILVGHLAE